MIETTSRRALLHDTAHAFRRMTEHAGPSAKTRRAPALALLTLMVAAALMTLSGPAFAASSGALSTSSSSDAGSVSANAESSTALGNDYAAAGSNVALSEQTIIGNLFAAGQNLYITSSNVGCDIFAAGEIVNLSDTKTAGNLFAAGQTINVKSGSGLGAFLFGDSITVDGTYADLELGGNNVVIKGTITGNVHVSAKSVTIDPNVKIAGELYVQADVEPTIPSTAKIGSYDYVKAQDDPNLSFDGGLTALAAVGGALWIQGIITRFLGMLLLGALLLLAFTDRPFVGAASLLREKPAALLLSGFITIIVLPLAALVFFLILVGWTIGMALILAASIISAFAGTFTALSFGRMFFGKMNKWLSSLTMIAIFDAILAIPVLNFILLLFCLIYFTGYLIMSYWGWRQSVKAPLQAASPAPPLAPSVPAPQPPAPPVA